MIEEGVDTFVEIGPGKTLSGFMKKITRSFENKDKAENIRVLNIEKPEDIEKAGGILNA